MAAAPVENFVAHHRIAFEIVRKATLASIAALSVLSLIPPLRFGAKMAIYGLAWLSTLADQAGQLSWQQRALSVAKLAVITLGIVATLLTSPILFVISIAVDIAAQISNIIDELRQAAPSILSLAFSASSIAVDALFLTAIITGSVPAGIAALSFSALCTLGIGIASLIGADQNHSFEGVCLTFIALTGFTNVLRQHRNLPRYHSCALNLAYCRRDIWAATLPYLPRVRRAAA